MGILEGLSWLVSARSRDPTGEGGAGRIYRTATVRQVLQGNAMNAPICTPIDSGGVWCPTTIHQSGSGFTWQQTLLVYLIVLAVTWTPLIVGRLVPSVVSE